MNLVKVDNHLAYIDTARFIERYILPCTVECYNCKAEVILDMPQDLQPTWAKTENPYSNRKTWRVGFECMVCHKPNVLLKNDLMQEKESKGTSPRCKTSNTDGHYQLIIEHYKNQLNRLYVWALEEQDQYWGWILSITFIEFVAIAVGICMWFGGAGPIGLSIVGSVIFFLTSCLFKLFYILTPRGIWKRGYKRP